MDFGLHNDTPGQELPKEWRVLLAGQVRTLTAILHRLQTDTARSNAAQLRTRAADAEQFLAVYAQQYVDLERGLTPLRTRVTHLIPAAPAIAQRLHTLERVLEVLHGNLAVAQRWVAVLSPRSRQNQ